jgi:hypothetical protein
MALLLHIVNLLTGEQDFNIHKLASPDYKAAVSYILAIIDNTVTTTSNGASSRMWWPTPG